MLGAPTVRSRTTRRRQPASALTRQVPRLRARAAAVPPGAVWAKTFQANARRATASSTAISRRRRSASKLVGGFALKRKSSPAYSVVRAAATTTCTSGRTRPADRRRTSQHGCACAPRSQRCGRGGRAGIGTASVAVGRERRGTFHRHTSMWGSTSLGGSMAILLSKNVTALRPETTSTHTQLVAQ